STKPISPVNFGASSELLQETHACFFSLIRDLFCATSLHRMQYNELRSRIDVWLRNPITALNDWYAQADNWSGLLMSAINFLAGDFVDLPEEYVPYIEFKPQQNIFQWIGAGRDSDTRLSTLCNFWLQRQYEVPERAQAALCPNLTESSSDAAGISTAGLNSIEMEEPAISYDGGVSPPPPPPPRCPTTWTVCAATSEEVIEFQRQERERFEQPHRAYTYRMHGYESVVGPVKGIYTQMYALTKARGHSMMIGNRPNFVTILTLVRDATARLPNGEGTRADIAELLKSSQYINLKEGENVLQTTVSGALDRMHTEHDPCVRYDPKRKIWIYLHRNRSAEDFERIHQQHQGIGKSKKVVHRKPKTKNSTAAKTPSEIADSNNIISTGDEENIAGSIAPTNNISKVGTAFSMPALVPANPIIVSSQSAQTQQKVASVTSKPAVTRSLPVPPLKYNIPQQKSLLKSTMQSHPQRQQHQQTSTTVGIDTQLQHNQRIQQRVANINKNTPTEINSEEVKVNKQLNLTISPTKSNLSVSNTGGGNSTPIIVATPTGLQTVHVSNATVLTTSTANSVPQVMQQSSLTATLGGKKLALNKPIFINQIRGQSATATTSKTKVSPQQVYKQQLNVSQQQQQKHAQGFIIPISMANSIAGSVSVECHSSVPKDSNLRTLPVTSGSSEGTTTIYMDNAQFISTSDSTPQEQIQQKQTQAKNIIRLVPSISSGAVKSILQSTSAGSVVNARKQPVHIIGHRVVTGNAGTGAGRAQPQQGKQLGNSGGPQTCGVASVVAAGSGSTLIKMSPQTFATLQQKQGQHVVVKQSPASSSSATNQQHRVYDKTTFLKNTTIVTQPATSSSQAISKTIFMQQSPTTPVIHKSGNGATSVGSQTSSVPITSAGKVHTISATNLSSQQQRVLLQNLKQQQHMPQSSQLK
ncbi:PREDICTED: nuclear factor related to kappa-B-binding protein-like, partial [Rhagoletis zephyria]|uniref:nuclear factor related to kappa-B-binding protein-like n=1 Tax=Rhagoletis zephyria TaxID=28612 RepID=UPI0008117996